MTYEQQLFLQIMADHLANNKTDCNQVLDWKVLSQYARIHQVEGIVYEQCKTSMPADQKRSFDQRYNVTLFFFKNREYDYRNICESFRKEGIDQFAVKGLEVASCYPLPALRTMGDLDIIVKKEDKEQAGKILESLGFVADANKMPNLDWHFMHNGLQYELHHRLIYDEAVSKKAQGEFFNDFWNYIEDGKLDWSFHFLFLIAHLRKHMLNYGAGFRMFLDLAAVIQKDPGLKWTWINEKLNDLEMGKFARVCFGLIEKWFGIKAPIDYPSIDKEFYEKATEKIFANGIFGFEDKRNQKNVAIYSLVKNGKTRGRARLLILINYIFPKYSNMRYVPHYRFLDGRPWLLPGAWIYRVYRLLNGKVNSIPAVINMLKMPNELLDEHEEELEKWGLG